MQRSKHWCCFFLILLMIQSCADKATNPTPHGEALSTPPARFAVISDLHVFDPALGTTGAAFEAAVSQDRKMIAESEAILTAVVQTLAAEPLDFILIPGDLTKDGERASHEMVAAFLQQLEDAGIPVFVAPGNHDINNPNAESYAGDTATPVESVSPQQFATIYQDFGYGDAIASDPNSLSYIAESVEGLRILSIDACRYGPDAEAEGRTGGSLPSESRQWIRTQLQQARAAGVLTIGMLHHGAWEHFDGQKLLFGDYVLDDYQSIVSEWIADGLRVVFTGHFHAQDVVLTSTLNGHFFDIETGSLVTYPCPYRIVNLDDCGVFTISSQTISQINFDTGGLPFHDYAKTFLTTGAEHLARILLPQYFNLSDEDVNEMVPHLTDALIAHLRGDETPANETAIFIQGLLLQLNIQKQIIGRTLQDIWDDPDPSDNDVIINLGTGEWTELDQALAAR